MSSSGTESKWPLMLETVMENGREGKTVKNLSNLLKMKFFFAHLHCKFAKDTIMSPKQNFLTKIIMVTKKRVIFMLISNSLMLAKENAHKKVKNKKLGEILVSSFLHFYLRSFACNFFQNIFKPLSNYFLQN